ncbi:hypothetical protein [Streptomyces bullii]|uniref:Uncharacterized protein n=1 Tax=Streptomyces bullii TaxID=349910 RepID=A0ABW0UQP6_9ACTN
MVRIRVKRLKLPKVSRPAWLKRPKVSRLARARGATFTGGGLIAAGVWQWFGGPVALVVAGALIVAYSLLIADVAEPSEDDRRPESW